MRKNSVWHSHLGIEDARIWLNNLNGSVESLLSEESVSSSNDSCEIQPDFLWVHVCLKRERKVLALPRWNLNTILLGRQIAKNLGLSSAKLWRPQAASYELDSHRLGLLVGEGELNIDRLAIDNLDTKDLRIWKVGSHLDIQSRRLGWVFDVLCKFLRHTLACDLCAGCFNKSLPKESVQRLK